MRRHQPARADAGHEESTREGEFSPNTVGLTVCRAGDIVGDIVAASEKGRLNFLFAEDRIRAKDFLGALVELEEHYG